MVKFMRVVAVAALILSTTSAYKPTRPTRTPSPSPGKQGDRCGAFTNPPQPPCASGLLCILDDPQLPDLGGVCLPPSRYTSTRPSRTLTLTPTPTPTPTAGKQGDRCGAFVQPPQPPCGKGLVCIYDDAQLPDLGGVCLPPSSTLTRTPAPTPTLGQKGDRCGAFIQPPQPPCAPSLICVLDDPQLPDLGGVCQPSQPPHSGPCYVKTVSVSGVNCPEATMGCPPADCIVLSTTMVPSGVVQGCESTPTITATGSCRGGCVGDCSTQWVTETATAW